MLGRRGFIQGVGLFGAIWVTQTAFAFGLPAAASPQPGRAPKGIYANMVVQTYVAGEPRGSSQKQIDSDLTSYLGSVLGNSAVSGLFLQYRWASLNPAADVYAWNTVDDAFAAVAQWNAENLDKSPKTIQFALDAGFYSPTWVLDNLASCDGMFAVPAQPVSSTCGKATFLNWEGVANPRPSSLPLPWNATYKNSWRTFLTAFAQRYGSNPAFVSIEIGGPTAATTEMILPNGKQDETYWSQWTAPHGGLLKGNYGDPSYWNSDKAFVEEWAAAIDMYGQIFTGITLVADTGDGLPNFANPSLLTSPPISFKSDCPRQNMDCAAETAILSYFSQATVGGDNRKATQESGLNGNLAADRAGNLTSRSVKWLAETTAGGPMQLPGSRTLTSRVTGGLQFGTGLARAPVQEGCTAGFRPADWPKISVACLAPKVALSDVTGYATFADVPRAKMISTEQSAFNVLRVAFDGTAYGQTYGTDQGRARLNYLQIYAADIIYAASNAMPQSVVVDERGDTAKYTVQDLLDQASQELSRIAEN